MQRGASLEERGKPRLERVAFHALIVDEDGRYTRPTLCSIAIPRMSVNYVTSQRETMVLTVLFANDRRRWNVIDGSTLGRSTGNDLPIVVERDGRDLDAVVENVTNAVEQRVWRVPDEDVDNLFPPRDGRVPVKEEVARLHVVEEVKDNGHQRPDHLRGG
jgi:hypothetical protein